MLLRVFTAAMLLVPGPAAAEALSLSSKATLGWTSNAEGAADGTGDIVLEHSHSGSFAHDNGGFALRGTFTLTESRYQRLWQENDRQIGAELGGQWRISPETLARSTLSLAYHDEGQALTLGSDTVGAKTPYFRGSIGVETESRFGDTLVIAGITYAGLVHGETGFTAPLLPIRTRADTRTLSGQLRISHALNQNFALTGLVQGLIQSISNDDQLFFNRLPARALRLAAGLEAAIGLRASFSLEAGADLLWGEAQGLDRTILPYAGSQLTLGLGGGFDFGAGFRTSFDFETPADGYADWTIEGRTGIGYAATQSLRIEAAIFASATRSIGFDVEHKSQFGAEISAQAELAAGITGRAGISHTRTSGLRPEYDEARLALTLAAGI